jgi:hypothetical protein
MMALPSLRKIRLSDFVVSFKPTRNVFSLVPAVCSVALRSSQDLAPSYAGHKNIHAHVVVKVRVGRVKM